MEKTTVKTIVRRLAADEDLKVPHHRFLVPVDGGHHLAKIANPIFFIFPEGKVFNFMLLDKAGTPYRCKSLDNIYLI